MAREGVQARLRRMDEAERATGRGSWEWDLSTDRAVWSQGMYHLFGLDPAAFENTNENFLRMVHPEDRARMGQAIEDALRRLGPFHQEYRFVRPDGEVRHLRGKGNVVPDGEGRASILYGFVEDVTDQKNAEAALRAANRELEAFAYSVSHDLRAPLRAMDGFARILAEDHAAGLDADARHCIDMIVDGAREMERLVEGLLALSRLGRQALERDTVDPAAVARRALDELAAERAGRDVRVEVHDMPPCEADPTLLRQVYANLLGNALKYTRRREHAEVEVGWSPADGAYFVRDNGVGFDMRHAGNLFGVFQRLHRADEYEGTGVGLAIVARVVARHGGRVWADAAVDRGATFSFTIPRGQGHA